MCIYKILKSHVTRSKLGQGTGDAICVYTESLIYNDYNPKFRPDL